MKVLFDTSVLVAASIETHPHHEASRAWLSRGIAGALEMAVSAHTLPEMYAVLTGMPLRPRIGPAAARRLVRENVERPAEIVALSASDYRAALDGASELGLSGGVLFAALVARAAAKAHADRLLTLNVQDFRRVWPEGGARVVAP